MIKSKRKSLPILLFAAFVIICCGLIFLFGTNSVSNSINLVVKADDSGIIENYNETGKALTWEYAVTGNKRVVTISGNINYTGLHGTTAPWESYNYNKIVVNTKEICVSYDNSSDSSGSDFSYDNTLYIGNDVEWISGFGYDSDYGDSIGQFSDLGISYFHFIAESIDDIGLTHFNKTIASGSNQYYVDVGYTNLNTNKQSGTIDYYNLKWDEGYYYEDGENYFVEWAEVGYGSNNAKFKIITAFALDWDLDGDEVCDFDGHLVIPDEFDFMAEGVYDYGYEHDPITTITLGSSLRNYTGGWDRIETINFSNSNNLKYIGDRAFEGCNGLTSITIPQGVEKIGKEAFSWCENISSITIPATVKFIGEDAFLQNRGGRKVYTPSLEAWLGIEFENSCSSPLIWSNHLYVNNVLLRELTIPSTVTKINNYAFYNCYSLRKVIIPATVTEIGEDAFANNRTLFEAYDLRDVPISTDYNEDITGLAYYLRSDGLKTSLDTPSNYWYDTANGVVYYIDSVAGYLPAGLINNNETSIVIDNRCRKIGEFAFYGYDCLTTVTIPTSVKTIESYAFQGCSNLTNVIFLADTAADVPSVGYQTFYDDAYDLIPNLTITVPANSSELYTGSHWPEVSALIVEAPEPPETGVVADLSITIGLIVSMIILAFVLVATKKQFDL